jgi:hypothetical protein
MTEERGDTNMGRVILDVKNGVDSPEGIAGGEYVQGMHSPVIITFHGPGHTCKETQWRTKVL